jgi:hypothetical protein
MNKRNLEKLAKIESNIRPYITKIFPFSVALNVYSNGRKFFLKNFVEIDDIKITIPEHRKIKV